MDNLQINRTLQTRTREYRHNSKRRQWARRPAPSQTAPKFVTIGGCLVLASEVM